MKVNIRSLIVRVIAGTTVLFLIGCTASIQGGQIISSKTPDFYPNEHYQQVGQIQAQSDTGACLRLADQYVNQTNKWSELAKGTAKGAVVGSGTGALGGVIMKSSVGRATGAGAAIGAILGMVNELGKVGEHSPSYERFVEHCLQKKGYEVIGWSA